MTGRRISLARQNLSHEKTRTLIASLGIGFAVVLLFIEIGFYNASLDSPTALIRILNGELILASKGKYSLVAEVGFPRERLMQARNCDHVESAAPLYLRQMGCILRVTGSRGFPIRVFATDLNNPALDLTELTTYFNELSRPQTALVDAATRDFYGVPKNEAALKQLRFELNRQDLNLVGHFRLNTDLVNDGNLLMSDRNYAHYLAGLSRGDPLSTVELGVIRLTDPSTAPAVKAQLETLLPDDVAVYTIDEFDRMEQKFWKTRVPVGGIFFVGAAVGFLVGVVICYQIIYSDAAGQLPEFATLKAIGYRPRYFYRVMIEQALYLAVFGFVPGVLASVVAYAWLSASTGLVLQLTPARVLLVFAFTVAMCLISGVLAIRKVVGVDPAELF